MCYQLLGKIEYPEREEFQDRILFKNVWQINPQLFTTAWGFRLDEEGLEDGGQQEKTCGSLYIPRPLLVPHIWYGGLHPLDRPGYCCCDDIDLTRSQIRGSIPIPLDGVQHWKPVVVKVRVSGTLYRAIHLQTRFIVAEKILIEGVEE